MKKFLIIGLLLCSVLTISAEEEKKDLLGFDLLVGGTFEFGDNISNSGSLDSMAQLLTSFRLGIEADLYFRIAGPLSVGGEAGFFMFMTSDSNGNAQVTPLIDIPVRGIVRLSSGKFGVQAHFGYNFSTTYDSYASNYIAMDHKMDVGGKVILGPVYLEYSRLFWDLSEDSISRGSNRVGIGAIFNIN